MSCWSTITFSVLLTFSCRFPFLIDLTAPFVDALLFRDKKWSELPDLSGSMLMVQWIHDLTFHNVRDLSLCLTDRWSVRPKAFPGPMDPKRDSQEAPGKDPNRRPCPVRAFIAPLLLLLLLLLPLLLTPVNLTLDAIWEALRSVSVISCQSLWFYCPVYEEVRRGVLTLGNSVLQRPVSKATTQVLQHDIRRSSSSSLDSPGPHILPGIVTVLISMPR